MAAKADLIQGRGKNRDRAARNKLFKAVQQGNFEDIDLAEEYEDDIMLTAGRELNSMASVARSLMPLLERQPRERARTKRSPTSMAHSQPTSRRSGTRIGQKSQLTSANEPKHAPQLPSLPVVRIKRRARRASASPQPHGTATTRSTTPRS